MKKIFSPPQRGSQKYAPQARPSQEFETPRSAPGTARTEQPPIIPQYLILSDSTKTPKAPSVPSTQNSTNIIDFIQKSLASEDLDALKQCLSEVLTSAQCPEGASFDPWGSPEFYLTFCQVLLWCESDSQKSEIVTMCQEILLSALDLAPPPPSSNQPSPSFLLSHAFIHTLENFRKNSESHIDFENYFSLLCVLKNILTESETMQKVFVENFGVESLCQFWNDFFGGEEKVQKREISNRRQKQMIGGNLRTHSVTEYATPVVSFSEFLSSKHTSSLVAGGSGGTSEAPHSANVDSSPPEFLDPTPRGGGSNKLPLPPGSQSTQEKRASIVPKLFIPGSASNLTGTPIPPDSTSLIAKNNSDSHINSEFSLMSVATPVHSRGASLTRFSRRLNQQQQEFLQTQIVGENENGFFGGSGGDVVELPGAVVAVGGSRAGGPPAMGLKGVSAREELDNMAFRLGEIYTTNDLTALLAFKSTTAAAQTESVASKKQHSTTPPPKSKTPSPLPFSLPSLPPLSGGGSSSNGGSLGGLPLLSTPPKSVPSEHNQQKAVSRISPIPPLPPSLRKSIVTPPPLPPQIPTDVQPTFSSTSTHQPPLTANGGGAKLESCEKKDAKGILLEIFAELFGKTWIRKIARPPVHMLFPLLRSPHPQPYPIPLFQLFNSYSQDAVDLFLETAIFKLQVENPNPNPNLRISVEQRNVSVGVEKKAVGGIKDPFFRCWTSSVECELLRDSPNLSTLSHLLSSFLSFLNFNLQPQNFNFSTSGSGSGENLKFNQNQRALAADFPTPGGGVKEWIGLFMAGATSLDLLLKVQIYLCSQPLTDPTAQSTQLLLFSCLKPFLSIPVPHASLTNALLTAIFNPTIRIFSRRGKMVFIDFWERLARRLLEEGEHEKFLTVMSFFKVLVDLLHRAHVPFTCDVRQSELIREALLALECLVHPTHGIIHDALLSMDVHPSSSSESGGVQEAERSGTNAESEHPIKTDLRPSLLTLFCSIVSHPLCPFKHSDAFLNTWTRYHFLNFVKLHTKKSPTNNKTITLHLQALLALSSFHSQPSTSKFKQLNIVPFLTCEIDGGRAVSTTAVAVVVQPKVQGSNPPKPPLFEPVKWDAELSDDGSYSSDGTTSESDDESSLEPSPLNATISNANSATTTVIAQFPREKLTARTNRSLAQLPLAFATLNLAPPAADTPRDAPSLPPAIPKLSLAPKLALDHAIMMMDESARTKEGKDEVVGSNPPSARNLFPSESGSRPTSARGAPPRPRIAIPQLNLSKFGPPTTTAVNGAGAGGTLDSAVAHHALSNRDTFDREVSLINNTNTNGPPLSHRRLTPLDTPTSAAGSLLNGDQPLISSARQRSGSVSGSVPWDGRAMNSARMHRAMSPSDFPLSGSTTPGRPQSARLAPLTHTPRLPDSALTSPTSANPTAQTVTTTAAPLFVPKLPTHLAHFQPPNSCQPSAGSTAAGGVLEQSMALLDCSFSSDAVLSARDEHSNAFSTLGGGEGQLQTSLLSLGETKDKEHSTTTTPPTEKDVGSSNNQSLQNSDVETGPSTASTPKQSLSKTRSSSKSLIGGNKSGQGTSASKSNNGAASASGSKKAVGKSANLASSQSLMSPKTNGGKQTSTTSSKNAATTSTSQVMTSARSKLLASSTLTSTSTSTSVKTPKKGTNPAASGATDSTISKGNTSSRIGSARSKPLTASTDFQAPLSSTRGGGSKNAPVTSLGNLAKSGSASGSSLLSSARGQQQQPPSSKKPSVPKLSMNAKSENIHKPTSISNSKLNEIEQQEIALANLMGSGSGKDDHLVLPPPPPLIPPTTPLSGIVGEMKNEDSPAAAALTSRTKNFVPILNLEEGREHELIEEVPDEFDDDQSETTESEFLGTEESGHSARSPEPQKPVPLHNNNQESHKHSENQNELLQLQDSTKPQQQQKSILFHRSVADGLSFAEPRKNVTLPSLSLSLDLKGGQHEQGVLEGSSIGGGGTLRLESFSTTGRRTHKTNRSSPSHVASPIQPAEYTQDSTMLTENTEFLSTAEMEGEESQDSDDDDIQSKSRSNHPHPHFALPSGSPPPTLSHPTGGLKLNLPVGILKAPPLPRPTVPQSGDFSGSENSDEDEKEIAAPLQAKLPMKLNLPASALKAQPLLIPTQSTPQPPSSSPSNSSDSSCSDSEHQPQLRPQPQAGLKLNLPNSVLKAPPHIDLQNSDSDDESDNNSEDSSGYKKLAPPGAGGMKKLNIPHGVLNPILVPPSARDEESWSSNSSDGEEEEDNYIPPRPSAPQPSSGLGLKLALPTSVLKAPPLLSSAPAPPPSSHFDSSTSSDEEEGKSLRSPSDSNSGRENQQGTSRNSLNSAHVLMSSRLGIPKLKVPARPTNPLSKEEREAQMANPIFFSQTLPENLLGVLGGDSQQENEGTPLDTPSVAQSSDFSFSLSAKRKSAFSARRASKDGSVAQVPSLFIPTTAPITSPKSSFKQSQKSKNSSARGPKNSQTHSEDSTSGSDEDGFMYSPVHAKPAVNKLQLALGGQMNKLPMGGGGGAPGLAKDAPNNTTSLSIAAPPKLSLNLGASKSTNNNVPSLSIPPLKAPSVPSIQIGAAPQQSTTSKWGLTELEQDLTLRHSKMQVALGNSTRRQQSPKGGLKSSMSMSISASSSILISKSQRIEPTTKTSAPHLPNPSAIPSDLLHAQMIAVLINLLLTDHGSLDPNYSDQYPHNNHKENILFYLGKHLSENREGLVISRHLIENSDRFFARKVVRESAIALIKLLCVGLFDFEGCYEKGERMGGGAYGEVFGGKIKAEEWAGEGRGSNVALKFIEVPSAPHDRCVVFDVHNEVRVLQTVKGDSRACQLVDFGVTQTHYILVMKKYDMSLKNWRSKLNEEQGGVVNASDSLPLGALPPPAFNDRTLLPLLHAFAKVLDSCQVLTERKVNHFDIKCENILLELSVSDGEAQFDPSYFSCALADFGESKTYPSSTIELEESTSTSHQTEKEEDGGLTTRNRGTEYIKSPEMLTIAMASKKSLATYDRRKKVGAGSPSDVWSIGCLFYELLTNQFLFFDPDWIRFFLRVTGPQNGGAGGDLITPERAALVGNNPKVLEFLNFCLIKDPARRPTIQDLISKYNTLFFSTCVPLSPVVTLPGSTTTSPLGPTSSSTLLNSLIAKLAKGSASKLRKSDEESVSGAVWTRSNGFSVDGWLSTVGGGGGWLKSVAPGVFTCAPPLIGGEQKMTELWIQFGVTHVLNIVATPSQLTNEKSHIMCPLQFSSSILVYTHQVLPSESSVSSLIDDWTNRLTYLRDALLKGGTVLITGNSEPLCTVFILSFISHLHNITPFESHTYLRKKFPALPRLSTLVRAARAPPAVCSQPTNSTDTPLPLPLVQLLTNGFSFSPSNKENKLICGQMFQPPTAGAKNERRLFLTPGGGGSDSVSGDTIIWARCLCGTCTIGVRPPFEKMSAKASDLHMTPFAHWPTFLTDFRRSHSLQTDSIVWCVLEKKRVNVATLACQPFSSAQLSPSSEEWQVMVCKTCGFITHAEQGGSVAVNLMFHDTKRRTEDLRPALFHLSC